MHITDKPMITVGVLLDAPIELVWTNFTGPEHITQWYNASDDWYAPYAENDLQVNGKFKTTMAAKDGSMGFDFEGVYTNIQHPQLIEYTIADGRKVSVRFANEGNQVKLVETFEAEEINSFEIQKGGWQVILNSFKKYTEAGKG